MRELRIVRECERAIVFPLRQRPRAFLARLVAVLKVRIEQPLLDVVVVRVLQVQRGKFLHRRLPVKADRLLPFEVQLRHVALTLDFGIGIADCQCGFKALACDFDLSRRDGGFAGIDIRFVQQIVHFAFTITSLKGPQLFQARDRVAPLLLRDQAMRFIEHCGGDAVLLGRAGCAAAVRLLQCAQFLLRRFVGRVVRERDFEFAAREFGIVFGEVTQAAIEMDDRGFVILPL